MIRVVIHVIHVVCIDIVEVGWYDGVVEGIIAVHQSKLRVVAPDSGLMLLVPSTRT